MKFIKRKTIYQKYRQSVAIRITTILNTKRAGKTPTRLCKFNRFYPANKTFCKYTTNFQIVKKFDKVFLQMMIETTQTYASTFDGSRASSMGVF